MERNTRVPTAHEKSPFEAWMESGGMTGAPLQPGEPSWTSEKCGGGPHTKEYDSTLPQADRTSCARTVIEYVGTNYVGTGERRPKPKPRKTLDLLSQGV